MKTIDLHIHTTASDGTYTPIELVDYAVKKNLSAISITDHDTMKGIQKAMDYINKSHLPIEFIPGMEMSASGMGQVYGIHILAYFIDKSQEEGVLILNNVEMDWRNSSGSPEEAIKIISEYGGITSLAHPLEYCLSMTELDKLIGKLASMGLKGLEAIYTTHTDTQIKQFKAIVTKYNLLITGGSDFHGTRKPGVDLGNGFGNMVIPYDIVNAMKNKTIETV
ncbi:PHP domain-containing protein [Labilibaculum antarcticum]|uniref:Phosphatase n=1 Tax=Labilibaculum antarcticum TaxID=1717717 RepID=A0A1Y1CN73_9BACT|nr:PHP domain-containing protein [Labilibaculum antarcticum]BAX81463.1 phosphatase [Labilibaculum antarcticum]